MEGTLMSQGVEGLAYFLTFKTHFMYSIYVYNSKAEKLFDYKSNVLPMVGDVYPGTGAGDRNYKVIKRLLHTTQHTVDVISVWAEHEFPSINTP